MAEAAAHQKALDSAGDSYSHTVRHALSHLRPVKVTDNVREALIASPLETQNEIRSLRSEVQNCRSIASGLDSEVPTNVDTAMEQWDASIRDWFKGVLDGSIDTYGQQTYRRIPGDLLQFLNREALPWLESRVTELENRPRIRDQAFGSSLNPEAMEKLARYEVHLDRKLEKCLGMLFRLKQLASPPPVSQNPSDVA